jgi:hypothetical protein
MREFLPISYLLIPTPLSPPSFLQTTPIPSRRNPVTNAPCHPPSSPSFSAHGPALLYSALQASTARGAKTIMPQDVIKAVDMLGFGPPDELKTWMEGELEGEFFFFVAGCFCGWKRERERERGGSPGRGRRACGRGTRGGVGRKSRRRHPATPRIEVWGQEKTLSRTESQRNGSSGSDSFNNPRWCWLFPVEGVLGGLFRGGLGNLTRTAWRGREVFDG